MKPSFSLNNGTNITEQALVPSLLILKLTFIATILLIAPLASSQIVDISECAQIENAPARYACYDKLASTNPNANAPAPIVELTAPSKISEKMTETELRSAQNANISDTLTSH